MPLAAISRLSLSKLERQAQTQCVSKSVAVNEGSNYFKNVGSKAVDCLLLVVWYRLTLRDKKVLMLWITLTTDCFFWNGIPMDFAITCYRPKQFLWVCSIFLSSVGLWLKLGIGTKVYYKPTCCELSTVQKCRTYSTTCPRKGVSVVSAQIPIEQHNHFRINSNGRPQFAAQTLENDLLHDFELIATKMKAMFASHLETCIDWTRFKFRFRYF